MKKIIHIIISIVYIVWGIGAPLTAIKAILALDVGALLTAGLMAVAFNGFSGLI